ncbi:MAG: hypothetical protein Q9202_000533 [Teloschistes flavicans]
MSSTSVFMAVVIPIRKRISFLDLPAEVRVMIYDYVLPVVIKVQKQPQSDLAISRVSRMIHREALGILNKRVFLSVKIEDRKTHTLALRWIDRLGGRKALTNIRDIRIDTWIEIHRHHDEVTFQRHIFHVYGEAALGLLVKFTVPPNSEAVTYRYEASGPNSKMHPAWSPCLASRPDWHTALRRTLYRGFRDTLLYSGLITVNKSGLKLILDVIIAYSEYYHLWRPLKAWNVESVAVQEVCRSEGSGAIDPSADQCWNYLNVRIIKLFRLTDLLAAMLIQNAVAALGRSR